MRETIITLVILIFLLIFLIYMLIRNNRVYSLRIRINKEIRDYPDVKKALKMYEKYNSITYTQMMNPFKSLKRLEKEWRKKLNLRTTIEK